MVRYAGQDFVHTQKWNYHNSTEQYRNVKNKMANLLQKCYNKAIFLTEVTQKQVNYND